MSGLLYAPLISMTRFGQSRGVPGAADEKASPVLVEILPAGTIKRNGKQVPVFSVVVNKGTIMTCDNYTRCTYIAGDIRKAVSGIPKANVSVRFSADTIYLTLNGKDIRQETLSKEFDLSTFKIWGKKLADALGGTYTQSYFTSVRSNEAMPSASRYEVLLNGSVMMRLEKRSDADSAAKLIRIAAFSGTDHKISIAYKFPRDIELRVNADSVVRITVSSMEDLEKMRIWAINVAGQIDGAEFDHGTFDAVRSALKKVVGTYNSVADFLKPLAGSISSGFGMRTHPVTHKRSQHVGIDIPAEAGKPVKASGDGKVVFAGWDDIYGNCVLINHGGLLTFYAHMKSLAVKTGQAISARFEIGKVGSTGRSTGAHLHYGVMKYAGSLALDAVKHLIRGYGYWIDPTQIMKR